MRPPALLGALALLACAEPRHALSQHEDTVRDPIRDHPSVVAAMTQLAHAQPWYAYQSLRPLLADSSTRTPYVQFLAATAASRWGGWRQVERHLARAPWLDTLFNGEGRVLLVQATLARDADSLALAHADSAVAYARDDRSRAEREVLRARALDRRRRLDSARAGYLRAADELGEIRDWLILRASGVTPDQAERDSLYASIGDDAAVERIGRAEASARERFGDLLGAATAYEALGDSLSGLRLRLVRGSASRRAAARSRLVGIIRSRPGSADAQRATEILDATLRRRRPSEELAIARSAYRGGPASRAAIGYRRAFQAKLGTTEDRLHYGLVSLRLNRNRTAAAQFARIPPKSSLAPAAAYHRARALLGQGRRKAARTLLRDLVRRHPRDTIAGSALMVLADAAMEDRRDSEARTALRRVAESYPQNGGVARARFLAGFISYVQGRRREAAEELDSLCTLYPHAEDALAATYWAGRAWAAVGDTVQARERWRIARDRAPLSYYSALASRRLGELPWAPPPADETHPRHRAVDRAMTRTALLEKLGMDAETRAEYDAMALEAEDSVDRLLATGYALRERGQVSRSISLGWRALGLQRGGDARVYRLIYPLLQREAIVTESRRLGIEPALVAALIRQESAFTPTATSSVGARGLMQIMPRVGRLLARSAGLPDWNVRVLYQPDVNLQLGIRHFDAFISYYDDVRALAAYNAGASRVRRWQRRAGVQDPEVFAERITFTETRDYVRIVLRNRDMYRALYTW